jgi:hypothetical protein
VKVPTASARASEIIVIRVQVEWGRSPSSSPLRRSHGRTAVLGIRQPRAGWAADHSAATAFPIPCDAPAAAPDQNGLDDTVRNRVRIGVKLAARAAEARVGPCAPCTKRQRGTPKKGPTVDQVVDAPRFEKPL